MTPHPGTPMDGIQEALISHAQQTGAFQGIAGHEPKSSPQQRGITVGMWVDQIQPVALVSGLDSTALRLVFTVRLYKPFLSKPEDSIDPVILSALFTLMKGFTEDFQLDGFDHLMEIDLLGRYGAGLGAIAGYANQDGSWFRTMTLTVPLIFTDVWEQVP